MLDILENQILDRQTFEGISFTRPVMVMEEASLASIVVEELKTRENHHGCREF